MRDLGRRGCAWLALIVLACWGGRASAVEGAANSWAVSAEPPQLVNGAPVLFRVKPPVRLETLSGTWMGHEIVFQMISKAANWYGLAGVALSTKPGRFVLALNGTTRTGKLVSITRTMRVRAANYRTITLTVARQYTAPSPEQQKKAEEDKSLKQGAFSHSSADRLWSGSFRFPLEAPISDVFGTRRTFNGKVQSVHQGLDFAAGAGTQVLAVNGGSVVLSRPLFFEGNCVILDHGQGLLTLYMHLSEITVKEGEQVKRGQVIGRVGGTGRATGPHLHLAVRWQGEYLNPATLLHLKLQ